MKNTIKLLFIFALGWMFSGCAEEVTVKFLVNTNERNHFMKEPKEDSEFYTVFIDDSEFPVIVADKSLPGESIYSRTWTLEDRNGFDELVVEDSAAVHLSFPKAGIYSISLVVNEQKETMQRYWIRVKDGYVAQKEEVQPTELVEFRNPMNVSEESYSADYSLEIFIDVFSMDEVEDLVIKHNGKKLKKGDYAFDENTQLVKATLKLKNGDNKVSYKATIEGEEYTNESIVEYDNYAEEEIRIDITEGTGKLADNSSGKEANRKKSATEEKNKAAEKAAADRAAAEAARAEAAAEAARKATEDSTTETVENNFEGEEIRAGFFNSNPSLCGESDGYSYKFKVTAERDVILDWMYFYTDAPGKVEVKILELSTVIAKETQTISGGKAQLSLEFADEMLEKGKTWEIRIETFPESGSQKPLLQELSGCSLSTPATPGLKLNWKEKNFITKLEYTY